MKALLKILGAGTLVFMVLAVAQEWEFFSAAWFGDEAPEVGLGDEDRKAASDTIHLALSLMGHLYDAGGDPRFAERMPASEGVIEEMLADIEYLARNHRRQTMTLERLEVIGFEDAGPEALEVRTREYWRVGLRWVSGGEAEPERMETTYGRYLVVRQGRGWRVEGWDVVVDPSSGREAAP